MYIRPLKSNGEQLFLFHNSNLGLEAHTTSEVPELYEKVAYAVGVDITMVVYFSNEIDVAIKNKILEKYRNFTGSNIDLVRTKNNLLGIKIAADDFLSDIRWCPELDYIYEITGARSSVAYINSVEKDLKSLDLENVNYKTFKAIENKAKNYEDFNIRRHFVCLKGKSIIDCNTFIGDTEAILDAMCDSIREYTMYTINKSCMRAVHFDRKDKAVGYTDLEWKTGHRNKTLLKRDKSMLNELKEKKDDEIRFIISGNDIKFM